MHELVGKCPSTEFLFLLMGRTLISWSFKEKCNDIRGYAATYQIKSHDIHYEREMGIETELQIPGIIIIP